MTRMMTGFVMSLLVAAGLAAQTGPGEVILNANTASERDLLQVPHLTPELTKTVLERRPLASIRDLDAILKGLTRKERTEVYGRLFVPVNLNAAVDAEILLIPGVGQRMLHEFKEYRPYKTMEQFRREIGKYVSRREVARLEKYVSLN